MQEKINDAIEALRQIILDGQTSSSQIHEIEKMIWQLRQMPKAYLFTPKVYLFTLDAHDTYGPFDDKVSAFEFAKQRNLTSYQILGEPDNGITPIKPS